MPINLAGWQILDKEGKIKIIFTTSTIPVEGFFLLERTNDETVSEIRADLIYTGSLSNSNEALYFFDENCRLQDEVLANPDWPAGDNSSKRTMERKSNFDWQTSLNPGGTPKSKNSGGYYEYYGGGGGGVPALPPPTPQFFPVIINEIMYNPNATDIGREWIEILNNGQSSVDLTNWKFYENGTNHNLKSVQGGNSIPAKGYAIITSDSQKFLNDFSNYSGIIFDSSFSLRNDGEEIAIKNGDLIIDKVNYDPSLGANGDGNSLQKFDNQWLAVPPTPGRKNEIPPPILEVSTTTLNFEAIEDVKRPKDQSLTIQNLGEGNLNWTANSSENWLKISPQTGSVFAHSSSTLKISIDINELVAGNYSTTTFNIEASGAQNSPKQISVNLIVYPKKFAQGLVISEVKISGEEFVEIYSPKDEATSTAGFYLAYFSKNDDWNEPYRVWEFPSSTIPARRHFLIGIYGYPNSDWQLKTKERNPYSTGQLSDHSGSIGIFSCDPKIATTTTTLKQAVEQAKECKIDIIAWGEATTTAEDEPVEPATSSEKSLGRKIALDNGKPNYLDLDNNRLDFEVQNPTPKTQNENLSPIAKFDFSPQNPHVGDNVLFDATNSLDPDGNITNFIWNLGNETTSTNSSTIIKFFSTSSDLTIFLSVVDNLGATSTATTTQIFVNSREPLSIVVNEISWVGTRASFSDEWIEFYNATSEDIEIINWSIFGAKTGDCLNFKDSDGFSMTKILSKNFLIYADRQESIATSTGQNIVDIWDDKIEMDDNLPGQLRLYDTPNCQGDLIDTVGEENGKWFFGNASNSISMERISAITTGATSTNWASNNLITRNGKDAGGNKINGTPKAKNSILISPTTISFENFNQLFNEFSKLTLTYLGSPYIIGDDPNGNTFFVLQEKTLNIEPGVVLKFVHSRISGYGSSLEVYGTLKAIGQENKKIIFTVDELGAGNNFWCGLHFTSNSSTSELDYTLIEKATACIGGFPYVIPYVIKVEGSKIILKNSILKDNNPSRGVWLVNSNSEIEGTTFSNFDQDENSIAVFVQGGNPTIENSIFEKNTYGIKIEGGADPPIKGNYFEKNKYPIYALDSYPSLTGNQLLNNDVNGILIKGNLSQNTTWKVGTTYVIDYYVGVMASITLTLEPGTVVKFKSPFSNLAYFQVVGSLIAEGEKATSSKIVFTSFKDDEYGGDTNNNGTSTIPSHWDWGEITFFSGSSSLLKNIILRYGGGNCKSGAGCERWNTPLVIQDGANVSQDNVEIEFCSPPSP